MSSFKKPKPLILCFRNSFNFEKFEYWACFSVLIRVLDVQDQIKDISKRHPSYLKGTPDFLRFLKDIGDLPDGAILATVDVSALYSNIKREDAVEAVRKALETRVDKTVPASFIVELLDLSTMCSSLTASCFCSWLGQQWELGQRQILWISSWVT